MLDSGELCRSGLAEKLDMVWVESVGSHEADMVLMVAYGQGLPSGIGKGDQTRLKKLDVTRLVRI